MPISAEPLKKKREENSFKGLLFAQFVEGQKSAGEFVDIETSQVDFIKKHQMPYVLVTASAKRPSWLSQLKTEEITDVTSGVSFIMLDLKREVVAPK
jgi:hypothetical protein